MTNERSFPLCFVLLNAMLAASVFADAVKLPSSALTADTFLVVTWDATHAKPADVLALEKMVVGDRMPELREAAASYQAAYDHVIALGLASASLIYRGDPDKTGAVDVLLCLRLAPGTDRLKLENAVKDESANRHLAPLEVTSEGNFLLVRAKGAAKGIPAAAERKALFDETAGRGDRAVSIAFVPTDAMHQAAHAQRDDELPEINDALRLIAANVRWMRIELDVGPSAVFEVTAQAKDRVGAENVVEAFKKVAERLKSDLSKVQDFYGALADGAPSLFHEMTHPTVTAARVSFTAKGKSLGGVGILLDLGQDSVLKSLPTADEK